MQQKFIFFIICRLERKPCCFLLHATEVILFSCFLLWSIGTEVICNIVRGDECSVLFRFLSDGMEVVYLCVSRQWERKFYIFLLPGSLNGIRVSFCFLSLAITYNTIDNHNTRRSFRNKIPWANIVKRVGVCFLSVRVIEVEGFFSCYLSVRMEVFAFCFLLY